MPETSPFISQIEIDEPETSPCISQIEIDKIVARLRRLKKNNPDLTISQNLMFLSLEISCQRYIELRNLVSKEQYKKYVTELRDQLQKIASNDNDKRQFESSLKPHDWPNIPLKNILARSLVPSCGFVWLSAVAVIVGAATIIPICFLVVGITFAAALFCSYLHSKYKEIRLASNNNTVNISDTVIKLNQVITEINNLTTTVEVHTENDATRQDASHNHYYYWLDLNTPEQPDVMLQSNVICSNKKS